MSNAILEKLFMSQPGSLVEAVRVVRQLDCARKACQAALSAEKKQLVSVHVVSALAGNEKISTKIHELKALVLGMNEKIQELERKSEKGVTRTPRRRDEAVCYSCHRQGHFVRKCPNKVSGNVRRGLRKANQSL